MLALRPFPNPSILQLGYRQRGIGIGLCQTVTFVQQLTLPEKVNLPIGVG